MHGQIHKRSRMTGEMAVGMTLLGLHRRESYDQDWRSSSDAAQQRRLYDRGIHRTQARLFPSRARLEAKNYAQITCPRITSSLLSTRLLSSLSPCQLSRSYVTTTRGRLTDGLSSQTNRYSMVNGQERIAEVSASTSIDARGKKQIEREQANKV